MAIIDRQWRVVVIALVAAVCAVGQVRAEAQKQGKAAQTGHTVAIAGVK